MDACSGAREICLYVPFLLYNCTGIPFAISNGDVEGKGSFCIFPSSYNLVEQETFSSEEDGLSVLPLQYEKDSLRLDTNTSTHLFSRRQFPSHFLQHSAITSGNGNYLRHLFPMKSVEEDFISGGSILSGTYDTGNTSTSQGKEKDSGVKAFIYSPSSHLLATELMVQLHAYFPLLWAESNRSTTDSWSTPFSLTPASGSATVVIPQPGTTGAFLISLTSNPIAGDVCGRIRVVVFQPRYVILNTCGRDLCYKQKGTNFYYRLGLGKHFHLHWTDRMRELLISIRFNEPGWQWSGSFLPDCLGDTQVKMRNFVSGETRMIRVEVQNADTAGHDVNTTVPTTKLSATYFIILSDDDSGFMPYRIDNYSMERIRIYQQKCEMFETIVHSYTSCEYAWDEPTFPHRLTIEVPGEQILGTYDLDDVGEHTAVFLAKSSEKPERKLHVSVHAEGAIKVLIIIDSSHHIIHDLKQSSFFGSKEQRISQKESQVDFCERIRIHLSIGISLVDSTPEELIYARAENISIIWSQNLDQQKVFFQVASMQIDNQVRGTSYPVMLYFTLESMRKPGDKLKEDKSRIQNENASIGGCIDESVFHLFAAKWRKKESSLVSFKCINIRVSPMQIEIEEWVLLQLLDFLKTVSYRFHGETLKSPNEALDSTDLNSGLNSQDTKLKRNMNLSQFPPSLMSRFVLENERNLSLPTVIPLAVPWQTVLVSSRKQRKIYVELLEVAALDVTLSFSSIPWMKSKTNAEPVSLLHGSSIKFQRMLMALVDVEGVRFHLAEISLMHLMASWASIQDILARHYSRQVLHELYKVVGSAGVIGNPMGFARNVGIGIKDFLSVSAKDLIQNPTEVIADVAQGSMSLFNNTVFAVSSAASQFSKAAHKGIVAFAIDEQTTAKIESQKNLESHGKGLLNEFFEGLTGLLQSPIRGAEKHGLPGVLSGIAMGTAGLVARPMASILEATAKTAKSIRQRSSPSHSKRYRVRLPRPVARDSPLLPYSWEDAIGTSVLVDCDDPRIGKEAFVLCKSLKQPGKFVVLTRRLILLVSSPSLIGHGSSEFSGIVDPDWVIEMEMSLENVFHVDHSEEAVNIVGSNLETSVPQKRVKTRQWNPPMSVPLSHMSVELSSKDKAGEVFNVLLCTIERGKSQRWGKHIFHRTRYR